MDLTLANREGQDLLAKALHNRWPIPESTRRKAMDSIEWILDLPIEEKTIGLKMKALNNLAKFDKINTSLLIATMPKHHLHVHVSELTDAEIEQAILEEAKRIEKTRAEQPMALLENTLDEVSL